jgi:hypothetical protein
MPRRTTVTTARGGTHLGFLSGPVLIDAAAGLFGLPRALLIPPVSALFVAATAAALRAWTS